MPSVSEKQRKFFQLVRAIQEGRAPNASERAKAVAKSMSKKDVRDFTASIEESADSTEINEDSRMNKSAINITSDLLWQIAGISALSGAGLAGGYGLSKYLSDQYILPNQIGKVKSQIEEVSNYDDVEDDSENIGEEPENIAPNYELEPVVTNEDEYLKASSFNKTAFLDMAEVEWQALAKGVATPVAAIVPALLTYHFTKKLIDSQRNKSLSNKVQEAKNEFEEILTKESSELQQQVDSLFYSVKSAAGYRRSDGEGLLRPRQGTYFEEKGKIFATPTTDVEVSPGADKIGLLYLAGALLAGGGIASYLALRNNLLKGDKDKKTVKALRGLIGKNLAAEALQSGVNIREDNQGLPIVSL